MFYWALWSLVCLLPYLVGMWQDPNSLLYVAGSLFGLLVVLSCLAKGHAPGGRLLGMGVLFSVGNGLLVVWLGPWLLALIYVGIILLYFWRFHEGAGAP